ncbi:hypothetical protein FDZ61_03200 [Ehrlichia ruminantium]|nr:hypothetical protein FDZ65_03205 [Ehrlichia ruminantium]QLK54326.1 hypothetical protein FDZ63_03205 [Ehrlichia ruminantium]QLK56164.1 hypothetical protein FDZ61_03200 [Ehrlichia ruminantium]QLK57079.1 hypothetical protein FDZ60_03215 [Ehrlichia ruminantium]
MMINLCTELLYRLNSAIQMPKAPKAITNHVRTSKYIGAHNYNKLNALYHNITKIVSSIEKIKYIYIKKWFLLYNNNFNSR